MKQFALHSLAAVATLAFGARAADENVMPWDFPADQRFPGCSEYPIRTASDLSLPCGHEKSKNEACPVVVKREEETADPPLVPCNTFVEIGTIESVHGVKRHIWGIVAGSAPAANFTDQGVTFGLSHGGFQQLCPFTCMKDNVFQKCVINPTSCPTGTSVKDAKKVGDFVLGGFSQLGKVELAHKFDNQNPTIPHYKPEAISGQPAEQMYYAGGLAAASDTEKNCPKVTGNFTKADLMDDCGYTWKEPCPMLLTTDDECFKDTSALKDQCRDITFYRHGITDAAEFCVDGKCPAMGEITLQFKGVAYDDSENDEWTPRGPRGLLTPAAMRKICPFVCGTESDSDKVWLPVCVDAAAKCKDGKALPNDGTYDFDAQTKITFPGSFQGTPLLAVKWVERKCGDYPGNSAVGTAAPGLLAFAAAAVVAMYSA